jgi:hypothetical protein
MQPNAIRRNEAENPGGQSGDGKSGPTVEVTAAEERLVIEPVLGVSRVWGGSAISRVARPPGVLNEEGKEARS